MIRDPRAEIELSGTEPLGSTLPDYRDWVFEYDASNRLSAVSDPMTYKQYFSYDSAGRITRISDKGLGGVNPPPVDSLTYEYEYFTAG